MKKSNKAIIVLALAFLLFSCNVDEKLPDYVNGEYVLLELEDKNKGIKTIKNEIIDGYGYTYIEIHNPVFKLIDDKFYLEPLPKKM